MPQSIQTSLLDGLNLPHDLADLSADKLNELADEIRGFLIDSVGKTGGHLSSSLGVVELTIALHRIFKSPQDKIVWDVGHQSYPHKILTGRKDRMSSLRQFGGLSGFSKREESPHDVFGAGHASTSISAALGMAFAMAAKNETGHAIAVIGDGALTGGMAFEALNHAGDSTANLLVVLNDNEMSISENVGAMSRYLGRILSSRPYSFMREKSRKILSKIPKAWELAKRTEEHFKGMMGPSTLFEELGFHYIGPIDGHDMDALLRSLKIMKSLSGPQLLHIITTKGKGFEKAEIDPVNYHGISGTNSQSPKPTAKKETYTQVFGSWLCGAADKHADLVAITPAMREGSGLVEFSEQFPKRFFDVGIAEQHALTLAAGMACNGLKPIVAIYSTFLQRAYDQLVHDIALQSLPVIFAIDRAGLVGSDGATHAGVFDLSFMRAIPNLILMAPAYKKEMQEMLSLTLTLNAPVAVRYPRGNVWVNTFTHEPIQMGKAHIVQHSQAKNSKQLAVLVFGDILHTVLEACTDLDVTVANMRFIKPLDAEAIDDLARSHGQILTIESSILAGGAGSAVAEWLCQNNHGEVNIRHIGLPDRFIEHGEVSELLASVGLDALSLKAYIKSLLHC